MDILYALVRQLPSGRVPSHPAAAPSLLCYAITTLVDTSRQLLTTHGHTQLSRRDAQRFLALLDGAKPTVALTKAVKKYKKRDGG